MVRCLSTSEDLSHCSTGPGSSFYIFNWKIIALQCYAGFCCTTTWISCIYTYNPSFLNLPLTPPHPTPLDCHRALGWAPCAIQQLLSILHMVMYMFQCFLTAQLSKVSGLQRLRKGTKFRASPTMEYRTACFKVSSDNTKLQYLGEKILATLKWQFLAKPQFYQLFLERA